MPATDLPGFDIDKAGVPGQNEQFKAPECVFDGNDAGYWVMLVTTEGIRWWRERANRAKVADADPVEGFPAITVKGDVTPNRCDVVVDVADSQYLMTTVLPDSTKATFARSCELAHRFAESAMSTLLGA